MATREKRLQYEPMYIIVNGNIPYIRTDYAAERMAHAFDQGVTHALNTLEVTHALSDPAAVDSPRLSRV